MRVFAGALIGAVLAFATIARAAPPLADYGKLPAVESMSLSPSGQSIAFVAVAGQSRKVVVRNLATGAISLVVNAGDNKLRDVRWMGDDHIGIFISQTGSFAQNIGNMELFQVSIYNLKTHQSFIVFRSAGGSVLPAVFGYFGHSSTGGLDYGYFAGLTLTGSGNGFLDMSGDMSKTIQHGYSDLYRVNLDTGAAAKISGGSERIERNWLLSPTGDIVAESTYQEDTADWRLYNHVGAGQQLDQAKSDTHDVDLLGLGRTPDTVVVQRASSGNEWTFWEYSLAGPNSGKALFDGKNASGPIWDEHTGLMVGGWGNPNDPWVEMFDPTLQGKFEKAKRPFKGYRVGLESVTSNLDKLVMKTEGAGDSGTYFLVDIPGHKAEVIGWNYPTILQNDVAVTKMVQYKAADGLDEEGVLTLPPGRDPKNLPVVVMPHGGPEAYDTTHFDYWAQAFASRGYAVFQPNFRGSDGYGKAFSDAGHGEWGRKMQTDISDGLASLVKDGVVDPKRACIVGGSYGGYAALAGVTVQHGLYRCAVSYGGVADLNSMLATQGRWENNDSTMRYWRLFMGAQSNGDATLAALSPARLASKADAPILVMYGLDDTVVPLEQSREMVSSLRAAGKPVEVMELPGEDHWLSKPATRTQFILATVAFVEKNNPPN